MEFENTIIMFEISPHEFAKLQNLVQKGKFLNLELKLPYLGTLGPHFLKTIVIFEINTHKFTLLLILCKNENP